MSELSFLHTADVHVATFDALLRELRPNTRATHRVYPELLAQARSEGIDSPAVRAAVSAAVSDAAAQAQVVLCTCSTIGGLAERSGRAAAARVQRVDRAMAEAAVTRGENIVVAAALASTLEPTCELVRAVATERGARIDLRTLLIDDAWALFESGQISAYHQRVATAISNAAGADAVVLAQASMAGARDHLTAGADRVLSSPELGLRAALTALTALTA